MSRGLTVTAAAAALAAGALAAGASVTPRGEVTPTHLKITLREDAACGVCLGPHDGDLMPGETDWVPYATAKSLLDTGQATLAAEPAAPQAPPLVGAVDVQAGDVPSDEPADPSAEARPDSDAEAAG